MACRTSSVQHFIHVLCTPPSISLPPSLPSLYPSCPSSLQLLSIRSPALPHNVGAEPYNVAKNRYANIHSCEFTVLALSLCVHVCCHMNVLHTRCGCNCLLPSPACSPVAAADESRVKLEPIEGRPGSDYINANYIDVRTRSLVLSCSAYWMSFQSLPFFLSLL